MEPVGRPRRSVRAPRVGGSGVQVVARHHLGDLLAVVGEGGPHVGGDGQVVPLAITPGQGFVRDLAEHLLAEPVRAAFRGERVGGDGEHVPAHEVAQGSVDGFRLAARHRDERVLGEALAEHAGHPDQGALAFGQGVESRRQEAVQGARDGHGPGQLAHQAVGALALAPHRAVVDEGADRLDGKEGDALGPGDHRLAGDRRDAGDQRLHQVGHGGGVEGVQ